MRAGHKNSVTFRSLSLILVFLFAIGWGMTNVPNYVQASGNHTYYVAPSANNSGGAFDLGQGTADHPFSTIEYAISQMH